MTYPFAAGGDPHSGGISWALGLPGPGQYPGHEGRGPSGAGLRRPAANLIRGEVGDLLRVRAQPISPEDA